MSTETAPTAITSPAEAATTPATNVIDDSTTDPSKSPAAAQHGTSVDGDVTNAGANGRGDGGHDDGDASGPDDELTPERTEGDRDEPDASSAAEPGARGGAAEEKALQKDGNSLGVAPDGAWGGEHPCAAGEVPVDSEERDSEWADDFGDFAEAAGAEDRGAAAALTCAGPGASMHEPGDDDDGFGQFDEWEGVVGAGATGGAAEGGAPGEAGGGGSMAMQQFLRDLESTLPAAALRAARTGGCAAGGGGAGDGEWDAAEELERMAAPAESGPAAAAACAAANRDAVLRLLGLEAAAAAAAEAAAAAQAATAAEDSAAPAAEAPDAVPVAAGTAERIVSAASSAAASVEPSPQHPAALARSVSASDPFGAAAAAVEHQPGANEELGALDAEHSDVSAIRAASGVLTGPLRIMEDFVGSPRSDAAGRTHAAEACGGGGAGSASGTLRGGERGAGSSDSQGLGAASSAAAEPAPAEPVGRGEDTGEGPGR
eukprot:jgi/Ulvmu1/6634/UM003_0272.1